MRKSVLGCAVVSVALIGCSGSTGPATATGAARMAIVSGDNQTATANAASLSDPVKGQLYRQPNGQVAFQLLDVVLPAKAYAGTTTLKGAPIVGAVVCWADVTGSPRLIPFSVCTNTNDSGLVAFNLRPDTKAGKAKGQVHWDSAGKAIVTDSVSATILAGPPSATFCTNTSTLKPSPDTIDVIAVQDAYGNGTPFRVIGDSVIHVQGDTVGTVAARTLTWTLTNTQPFFGTLVLKDSTGATVGHLDYGMGTVASPRMSWKSYGTSVNGGCSPPA